MYKPLVIALLFCSLFCVSTANAGNSAAFATPEGYTKKVKLQPAETMLIEEDDYDDALTLVNQLHGQMAEDGWELFDIMGLFEDEEFEGFFVTYKKKKRVAKK